MKHLKRYNESIGKIDPNYIKLVFIDFIDEGSEFKFISADENDFEEGVNEVSIIITLPILEHKSEGGHDLWSEGDIDIFLNNAKEVVERYEDIKSCINKVLDKYPNIKHVITKEADFQSDGKSFSYVYVYFKW